MVTARLSSKGQLVIPKEIRAALHLRTGDRVRISLEHGRLILDPEREDRARLVRERGRRVLVASAEAPIMTTHEVQKLLSDFP